MSPRLAWLTALVFSAVCWLFVFFVLRTLES